MPWPTALLGVLGVLGTCVMARMDAIIIASAASGAVAKAWPAAAASVSCRRRVVAKQPAAAQQVAVPHLVAQKVSSGGAPPVEVGDRSTDLEQIVLQVQELAFHLPHAAHKPGSSALASTRQMGSILMSMGLVPWG
jgi:hypothetical protein